MAIRPTLYLIIRPSSKDAQPDATQELVAVPERPWWDPRPQEYFLVTYAENPEARVQQDFDLTLSDFASGHRMALRFNCLLRCRREQGANGRKLAEALMERDPGSSERMLDTSLRRWVDDFIDGDEAGFIRAFQARRDALAESIRTRAKSELGLDWQVKIEHSGESQRPTPLRLEIDVRPCDWHEHTKLRVDLTIEIDREGSRVPVDRTEDELRGELIRAIQDFFVRNVKIEALRRSLQEIVKPALHRYLNQVLAAFGRKVSNLILGSGPVVAPSQTTIEVSHLFRCTLDEHRPDPISVEARMHLDLQDVARWAEAGQPDIASWSKRNIEEVTKRLLFGMSNAALNISAESKKQEIKAAFEVLATQVGYSVRQVLVITDLLVDKLSRYVRVGAEGVDLETKQANERDALGEYTTAVPNVKVKLMLAADLRIIDLQKSSHWIRRGEDPRLSMPTFIHARAQEVLRTVSPRSFYLEFDAPLDAATPRTAEPSTPVRMPQPPSVRSLIERAVVEALHNEYGAEVRSIVCQQGETDVLTTWRELIRESHPFVVEVNPHAGTLKGQPLRFPGTFEVREVDDGNWYVFLTKLPDRRRLVDELTRLVSNWLSNQSRARLIAENPAKMLDSVRKLFAELARANFGLRVEVISWTRESTIEGDVDVELDSTLKTVGKQMMITRANALRLENQKRLENDRLRVEAIGVLSADAIAKRTQGNPVDAEENEARVEELREQDRQVPNEEALKSLMKDARTAGYLEAPRRGQITEGRKKRRTTTKSDEEVQGNDDQDGGASA
jgi:hypothetical protein